MAVAAVITGIRDGFYTVVHEGKHHTFRVRTQPADASFAPGQQIAAYLRGPNNESDYVNFAFVQHNRFVPWKRFQIAYQEMLHAAYFLVATPARLAESGKMYALESGNCCVCNRMLTTPESIAAGIGPTCAGRM